MNNNIVEDFREYAADPGKWVWRYQYQCRFHEGDVEKEFPIDPCIGVSVNE